MDSVLCHIIEYAGRSCSIYLVCHGWADKLDENDAMILADSLIKYKCASVSETIILALRSSDAETIRLLTTAYVKHIPIPWNSLSQYVQDHKLARYFSYRAYGDEDKRLMSHWYNALIYDRSHYVSFGLKYKRENILSIFKAGIMDDVWEYATEMQQQDILREKIEDAVRFLYTVKTDKKNQRAPSIIINIDEVPYPEKTIPWLYVNGYITSDPFIDAVINDDISLLPQISHNGYLEYKIITILGACNIAQYRRRHLSPYLNEEIVAASMHDEETMTTYVSLSNIYQYPSIMQMIWRETPFESVRNTLFENVLKYKLVEMIDIFLDKSNYMMVIISAIQENGMYDALYDLLIFRQIHAEWFAFYLNPSIDAGTNLPSQIYNPDMNVIKIPKSIDQWISLCNAIDNIRKKIVKLQGMKAPRDIWPALIGNAIIYDRDGSLLTSLVREHASEITPPMISEMKKLVLKTQRDGGWPSFVKSLISLGVDIKILKN